MTDDSDDDLDTQLFDQLLRGEQERNGTLYDDLHRIPADLGFAAGQIRRLLDHARDELEEAIATAGNILRWHGRDEILAALGQKHARVIDRLELLRETARKYDDPNAA